MGQYELSIKIEGLDTTVRNIDGVAKRAGDLTPAWRKIAVLGFKDVIQHFRDTAGPEGRWKALKPSTIKRRRKGSSVPLQDTGRLRNSLMPGRGITKISPRQAILSTNVEYAGFHEFGTSRIPKRSFMWISKGASESMERLISIWVVEGK